MRQGVLRVQVQLDLRRIGQRDGIYHLLHQCQALWDDLYHNQILDPTLKTDNCRKQSHCSAVVQKDIGIANISQSCSPWGTLRGSPAVVTN